MAEFPWAEAYPERAGEQARQLAMQHDAFRTALGGIIPTGGLRGFSRLSSTASRPTVSEARAAMERMKEAFAGADRARQLETTLARIKELTPLDPFLPSDAQPGLSGFRSLLGRAEAGGTARPWVPGSN